MVINIILIATAVAVFAINQLILFGQFKSGWWSKNSWIYKYKTPLVPSKPTLYNKFYKLAYRERFPGSGSIFVAFTDGYHATQFVWSKLVLAAVASSVGDFLLLVVVWNVVFNITFYIARK